MKVAIVGSRTFTDGVLIQRVVNRLYQKYGPELVIVSGGAKGADSLGEECARAVGLNVKIFLPDWDLYGKSAGYKRNVQIVNESNLVIAFFSPGPRSKGTQHSVDIARAARIPVEIYHEGIWERG